MTIYIRLDVVYTKVCLWLNIQQILENVSLNVAAEVDFCCCQSKLWTLYIVGKSISEEKWQTKTGGEN